MPRIATASPATAATPDTAPSGDLFAAAAFASLSAAQKEVLRLTFQERWTQFRIAQYLRVTPRTVRNYKTEALTVLKASPKEMYELVERLEGRSRYKISIEMNGEVENKLDSTLFHAAQNLTNPEARVAFYARDSTPDEVRQWRNEIEKRIRQGGRRASGRIV